MGKKKNHAIIVGGGRFGNEIATKLYARKKNFVLIENDANTVSSLRKKNYVVIEGNAEEDKVLLEAGVDRANKIILTLPKTETNILITLSAREYNPKIEVFARSTDQKFVSKLKKAGAKKVIVPEIIAGDEIGEMIS